MVIVVVKDYREAGGLDTKMLEPRTGKRPRAQPPGGWVGESSAIKKRSVGERMEKMTKLLQKNATKEDEVKHERKHSSKRNRRSRSKSTDKNGSQKSSAAPSRKESIDEGKDIGRDKKIELSAKEKEKEVEDWRASLKQMLDEIKKVKELPQVIVPDTLAKAKQKKSISMSMPDVSNTKKSGFSLTYADIKLKHLNRRTKEIVHNAKPSETVEKESIRVCATPEESVAPREKTFSFSENKTNVVTDVAFVGSSYVGQKEMIAPTTLPRSSSQLDCKTGLHKNTNIQTKSTYKVHMDLKKIKIIDQMKPPSDVESTNEWDRLEKLLMFNRIPQQLMLKCENWEPEPVTGVCEPMQTESSDDLDMISPESPMVIENQNCSFMSTILEDENEVKEALMTEVPEVTEVTELAELVEPGHIGKKMHGAIADMDIVCVKKRSTLDVPTTPGPKQPKPAKKVSSGAKAVDWREEVKKKEKEKQVAKLKAIPLGMPDYKEPEKVAVVDWRDAVAKQAEDNSNPLNKWKAFTKKPSGREPMPKKEEIVCSCLKGNCKLHAKVQPKWKAVAKRKDDDNKDEQLKKVKSTENLVKSKSVSNSKENLSKSSQVLLNDQHSPSKESVNDTKDNISTIANEQTKIVSRSKENLTSIANKENKATEIENLVLQKLNAQCISEAEPPVTKLKRTGSIKKKPLQPVQKVEKEKAPVLKTVEQQDRSARAPSVSKETVKIINFVAIKVGVEDSPPAPKPKRKTSVKKPAAPYSCHHMGACGCIPPPPKIKPPPPPPPSPPPPPPPPKEPTPPPPPPPTPPPPPPPPKDPTPPPPPPPIIRQIVKAPKSPPLPARKYFDDPEPIKPRPFSFHENKPVYCKQKRVDDISVAPITRKRWSTDVETKPLKFSTFGDNCIKTALFLGDSYVGGSNNAQSPQNGTSKEETSNKTSTKQNLDKTSSKGSIYAQYSNAAKSSMENENKSNEHIGDSKYKKVKENGSVPSSTKIENVENGVVRRDDVTSPKLNCDKKRNKAKLTITGVPQVNGTSWRTKFHNDLRNEEKDKETEKRKTWNDYIWDGSRNKNEDNPPKGSREHRSIKEKIGLLSPTVTSPLGSNFTSPYASKKTTPNCSRFNSPQGSPESQRKNYLNPESPRKSSLRRNSATSIVGILNKLAETTSPPPTSKKPWAQENKSNEKKKV